MIQEHRLCAQQILLLSLSLITITLASNVRRNIAFSCVTCDEEHSYNPSDWVDSQVAAIREVVQEKADVNFTFFPVVYTDYVNDSRVEDAANRAAEMKIGLMIGSGSTMAFMQRLALLDTVLNFTFTDTPAEIPDHMKGRTEYFFFREDMGGFLAGVLAAMHTSTGHVGCVAGPAFTALKNFGNGFLQGARTACATCFLHLAYLPNFVDGDPGIQIGKEFVSRGVDVIFGAAGTAGSETIKSMSALNISVIGVDSDEYYTTFSGPNITDKQRKLLLSSALKNTASATRWSVSNALDGNFAGGLRVMGVKEGAIGLADYHDAEVAHDTKNRVNDYIAQLAEKPSLTRILPATGDIDISLDDQHSTMGTSVLQFHSSVIFSGVNETAEQAAEQQTPFVLVVPMGAIELFIDSDWTTIKWLQSRAITYFPIHDSSDEVPFLRRRRFTAKAIKFTAGYLAAVVFGGEIYNTTLAENDLWVLQFSDSCMVPNMCWIFPYWRKVSLDLGDAPPPRVLPFSTSENNTLFILGGRDQVSRQLVDFWVITLDRSEDTTDVSGSWSQLDGVPISAGYVIVGMTMWYPQPHSKYADSILCLANNPDAGVSVLKFDLTHSKWLPGSVVRQSWAAVDSCCAIQWNTRLLIVGGSRTGVFIPELNNIEWDSPPSEMIPSGPVSCAVEEARSTVPEHKKMFTLVQNSRARVASYHHVHILSHTDETPNRILMLKRPAINCSESYGLAPSRNGTMCLLCSGTILNQICYPRESKGASTATYAVPPVVAFVVGVIIGFSVWRILQGGPRATRNAPLKPPCALALINVPGAARHWRIAPRKTAAALKKFCSIVFDTVSDHNCYEICQIGDAHFIAANTPEQALRMTVDLFDQCVNAQWPENAPLLVPCSAIHYGSPEIVSTAEGITYRGMDAEVTVMLGRRADKREIVLSATAIEAIQSDISNLELVAQREELFGEYGILLNYSIFNVTQDILEPSVNAVPSTSVMSTDSVVEHAQFTEGLVQNHMLVQTGMMTHWECVAALHIVYEVLKALMKPLEKSEQEEVLRRVMLRIHAGEGTAFGWNSLDDKYGRAAYYVLQLLDPIEFRIMVEVAESEEEKMRNEKVRKPQMRGKEKES